MFSQFIVRPKADRGVVKRMAGCAGGRAWGMFIQRSMLESLSCRTSRLWLDGRVCREATEGQVEFAEAYRVAYVPGVQIVDLAFIAMLSRYAVQIESRNQYLISGATNRPARYLQTATGATKRPNYGAQERRLALGSCPSWRVRSGCAELISQ